MLAGLCVAAALSLGGSIGIHHQIGQSFRDAEARCSKIPAAGERAACTSLAQAAVLLQGRAGDMLVLQGLCFALIVAGGLLALLHQNRQSAARGTESVHPFLPCAGQPWTGWLEEAVGPPDREADAALVLAPILASYCGSEISRSRLLAALTHLQSALGATQVSLQLESTVCQPLGSGPLLCVPAARDRLQAGSAPDRSPEVPASQPGRGAGAAVPAPLRLPLSCGGITFGVLVVELAQPPEAHERQLRLSRLFADLTALAIAGVCRSHEDRRIALMEERSAIAGELHDSLSQALAFLKIQVAQLQRAMEREGLRPEFIEAAGELRHGLSAAYRQVRELIAAFRVRMAPDGLAAAVRDMIEELGPRGGLDIAFEHDFGACRLEADEEFHVMQIVRESLFNTVRHAAATQAWVSIRYAADAHLLRVCVADNGRGLSGVPAGRSHHGLTVMQQRARSLHGELDIQPRPEGGTVVQLSFAPQRLAAAQTDPGVPR